MLRNAVIAAVAAAALIAGLVVVRSGDDATSVDTSPADDSSGPSTPTTVEIKPVIPDAFVAQDTVFQVAVHGNELLAVGTSGLVQRIDPATDAVTGTIQLEGGAYDVAVDGDAAWVTNGNGLAVVDLATNKVTGHIDILEAGKRTPEDIGAAVEVGKSALWFAVEGTGVYRIDRATGAVLPIAIDRASPESFAVTDTSVFVPTEDGKLVELSAADGRKIAEYQVGKRLITAAAAPDGTIWATDVTANELRRFDPKTGGVTATATALQDATAVFTTANKVWVSARNGVQVIGYDLKTAAVTDRILRARSTGVVVASNGEVWIASGSKTLYHTRP